MNRSELVAQIRQKKSFLCVGLDPDLDKIPKQLLSDPDPIFAFNKCIIDATQDITVAYKPNLAFYEALGPKGLESLKKTVDYIPSNIFTIADAKRGDIGNTAEKYAQTFFEYFNFDAITLSPYMGLDSIQPFLKYNDKWVIVLVRTSNSGGEDFQSLKLSDTGKPLYQAVLEKSMQWGNAGNMMFVVGAQRTEELALIRQSAKDFFVLIPGLGAQGGTLSDVTPFLNEDGSGILANYARQIIYAGTGVHFQEDIRASALSIAESMAQLF